jgi:hypothetical protein
LSVELEPVVMTVVKNDSEFFRRFRTHIALIDLLYFARALRFVSRTAEEAGYSDSNPGCAFH